MRHAGGALARGSYDLSAFGNRDAQILLEILGLTPTKEAVGRVRSAIDAIETQLADDPTGGRYLNFDEGDDRRYGVRAGVGLRTTHGSPL